MPSKRRATSGPESPTKKEAKRAKQAVAYGDVLTCGQNTAGELGFDLDDHPERKLPSLVKQLKGKKCISITTGGMHTVALTSDGTVYTFGCNDEGALGRACVATATVAADEAEAIPTRAEGLDKVRIIKVTAGDSHTCALSDDGRVFAAGMFRDSSGQWAFSETELIAKQFVPIYPPALRRAGQDYPPARDVVSGCQHVVVLAETDDGATTVFTRGCAEQGQLGRVSKNKSERGAMFRTISDAELPEEFVEELECRRTTPSCLQNLLAFCPVTVDRKKKVAKVFAGGYSTVAVTDDGATYGWGLNNYGQLAIAAPSASKNPEDRVTTEYFPKRAKLLKEVPVTVSIATHHTVALTDDGKVLAWGRGDAGQLGKLTTDGSPVQESYEPLHIDEFEEEIESVAAGGSSSFAVTKSGKLYSWGFGENQQLASGDDADIPVPALAKGKRLDHAAGSRVLMVEAGGQHTCILASGVPDLA